ncbi:MAG TPA: TonB-dependent receptor [Rhizomicrobium sp.]|jgi:iron complex outermembrane receptor protein
MRIGTRLALLGGVAGCLFATQAAAQIETVVVTAEKRAENMQKVPIAVSAVTGESLERRGTIGFKELQNQVPSLRFGAGVTGGENVITMRGLGSQNTTPGGDSPVAYNVDGIYLQRTTAIDPEFYDIERVEVLRGPQGTLYGRNSVGGTINIIDNKPTDELSGSVDALVGDYTQRTFRAWLSGPLLDDGGTQILFRITAGDAQHSPYATNLSTSPTANHDLDAEDFQMARGQLLFKFNPDMTLLLSASLNQNFDIAAANTAWWEAPARYINGSNAIPLGSPCDFHTAALYKPRVFCQDAPEDGANRITLFGATYDWDLGWAGFTSVSGYSTSAVKQTSDGDGSDAPLARGTAWVLRQHQMSEEVRLHSNDDANPLKWIAGFYYFWSDNFENFAYKDSGKDDTPFTLYSDKFNFLSHGHTKTRSYAPFGQVDYDLAKTSLGIPLTITAGLRYSNDEKYGTNYLDYQLPINPPFGCGGSCGVTQGPFSKSWGQMTGKFGLSYQASDDVMVYASASRGYLSGGNIIGLAHVYGPETAWSYETGLKDNFWDGRAQLNIAAYHEEISDLQVFIQNSTQSGINNVNGLTQVNGIETEFTWAPIDNLQLNSTVTLTSAHYGKYVTTDARFGSPPPGCDLDASGNPVPGGKLCNFKGNNLNQTPPYSVDVGAQYTFETPVGDITPRIDTYFSGRVDFLPDNLSPQKAYTQTNIHLTWQSVEHTYGVEAFVNNVENNDVISNDGLQSVTLSKGVLEPDNYVYYPPRTFGIRLTYNFNTK